jgi:hypothetical protein
MGRPIASTEPNARIRMTMANAMPSTSEDEYGQPQREDAAAVVVAPGA